MSTHLFLLAANGTDNSVRVFPNTPTIETIIAQTPKALRLNLWCSKS